LNKQFLTFGLLACATFPLMAQNAAAPSQDTIEIRSRTNKGDLPYRGFYRAWSSLQTFLPPAPRAIDPIFQMSFSELDVQQQDGYLMPSWNVSIVGDAVDIDVPVLRGGYFLLPPDEKGLAADASIMFNSQTRKNFLAVAWRLPLTTDNSLSYRDFARSFKEVAAVQAKIPWYSLAFAAEKRARFDALKACFAQDDGDVLVAGTPVPTIRSANCRIYRFDPALASTDAAISVRGTVEIVVLEDSERYRSLSQKAEN
jgi:hypothetical protein